MSGVDWKIWGLALTASLLVHAGVAVGVRLPEGGAVRGGAGPEVSVSGSLQGILGGAVGAVGGSPAKPVVARDVEQRAVQSVAPPALEGFRPGAVVATRAKALLPRKAGGVVSASAAPVLPGVVERLPEVAPDGGREVAPQPSTRAPPIPDVRPVRPVKAEAPRSNAGGGTQSKKPARSRPDVRPSRRAKSPRSRLTRPAGDAVRAGSSRQGSGGTSRGGGRSAVRAGEGAVRSYGARVRARILSNSPSAGGVGRAVVTFGVSGRGGLRFVRVARSSGSGALDRAAISAVRRSQPFPRPPRGASAAQLTFSISFNFR